MKLKLQLLLFSFFVTCLFVGKISAQVNYSEDFEEEDSGWSGFDFWNFDGAPCNGDYAFTASVYVWSPVAESVSPSLGTSSGGLVTFNYNYKIVNYADDPPYEATANEDNWGFLQIYYATSEEGPFTLIQTIDPSNHIESISCAAKTVTFNPPAGVPVYIGIHAELGDDFNDFYVILDDFEITQAEPIACNGTPPDAATVASTIYACNSEDIELSIEPANNSTGITYQWQWSTDGIEFTDVPAEGTESTYSTTQTATHWYRVNITCTESEVTTTSTPIMVVNSGAVCYCDDLEFDGQIEPITLVNFAGINNASSASVTEIPSIENFTSLPPGQVTQGETYPIILKGNTNDDFGGGYVDYFKVYIDFNHNGSLSDPGETFELGSIVNSNGLDDVQLEGSITIPADASLGYTYMRIVKNWDDEDTPVYLDEPCGNENSGYGQAEDYIINVEAAGPCETLPPVAAATQTLCGGATVGNIAVTGNLVKWYADETGGTPLVSTLPLVDGTHYFASQTVGCESETRTEVTITLNTIEVDDMDDVAACSEYILPELENGAYYTATGGEGDMLEAGDTISETATIYVYAQGGTAPVCSAETSFMVTIGNAEADEPDDVTACSEYILPELENGAYYTAAGGTGDMLEAGDAITETTTLYVYSEVGTAPDICTAENSFTVTINNAVVDTPEDVAVCSEYVLPELENGNYYTATGGDGDMLEAGDAITETTTIYVYAETDTAPVCTAESSFIVTINNAIVDELENVAACSSYELPELENGSYYTATGGSGDTLEAGDTITETTTLYVYSEVGTAPDLCTAESTFTVTITNVAVDEVEDITACFEHQLAELENGAYYTEPGGEGDMLEAGDIIEETMTIYVYASEGDCSSETSFIVTVNAPLPPSGDDTIEFTSDSGERPLLSEIELEAEGTIIWYASEEDAENGTNPLPGDTVIPEGTTIYYATQKVGECESEALPVTVDVVLGREDFDSASFRYHPNPVSDVLTLSYSKTITGITVYNLLGQPVMEKTMNSNNAQVNLSQLAAGTYMVKVQAEDTSKIIKVIKK